MEYDFTAITPRSTLTWIKITSMGQIERFNHLLRIIIIEYLKPYSCVQIICIA